MKEETGNATTGDVIEPPPLLRVVDWEKLIEQRIKRDSKDLFNVLGQPDGAAIYGLWSLLVEHLYHQPGPREGWLTEDGTREGSRFTVEAIGRLFYRPLDEVRRMLQVTTYEDVNWLRVVEGDFDYFLWVPILRAIPIVSN